MRVATSRLTVRWIGFADVRVALVGPRRVWSRQPPPLQLQLLAKLQVQSETLTSDSLVQALAIRLVTRLTELRRLITMAAQAPTKIDRQTTTPFLLRLFFKQGAFHR